MTTVIERLVETVRRASGYHCHAFDGKVLRPQHPDQAVSRENIEWHNERVYLG